MAKLFGQPLMPWQQMVADVGGEIDPATGLPAYREVIFTVPRQSGKTTLILAWELQRALGWGEPQRIIYSAQSGKDAREKIMEDQAPILERHKRALGITKITKGIGYESVRFSNGSLIKLLASSEESGHGKTLDLAIKDEYFADEDDRRDQALVPAMTTRDAAQMLTATTAGTDKSIPWNRRQRLGRQFVADDRRDGIAYFEWSADPATWDPEDEEAWWGFMPALGHTIQPPAIRHARDTLDADEFYRAYGNISHETAVSTDIIPADMWLASRDDDIVPTDGIRYAIDATPDLKSAAISVSDGHSARVVEHHDGVFWLPAMLKELLDERPADVWLDPKGPINALLVDLEELGIAWHEITPQQHAQACGGLLASVLNGQAFRHGGQPILDAAVEAATRRPYGDAWAWNRRTSSADICSLVAVTIARWAALQAGDGPSVYEERGLLTL